MSPRHRTDPPSSEHVLLAGIVLATGGVALAMDPGGYAVFAPAKALVLSLATIACLLGLALRGAERREHSPSFAPSSVMTWLICAFVLVLVLSLVTSVDRSLSLLGGYPEYTGAVPTLFAVIVGVAACAYGLQRPDLARLSALLSIAVAIIAFYAIAQTLGMDLVQWRAGLAADRARSFLGNSSNLGVFLAATVPYVVWSARRAKTQGGRIASVVVAGLAVLALAMTLSRGAWVGAAAGAAFWLLLIARDLPSPRRVRLGAGSIAALAAAAVAVLLVPGVWSRLSAPWLAAGATGSWRLSVWRDWIALITQSPLLGFGPSASGLVAPRYLSAQTVAGIGAQHTLGSAHNALLDVASGVGLPAAILLVAIVVLSVRRAWLVGDGRTNGTPVAELGASVVAIFVALQFHFLTLDTLPLAAVSIGLLLGVTTTPAKVTRREPETRHRSIEIATIATLLALAVGSAVAFGLLLLGDRAATRGLEALARGSSWNEGSTHLQAASSLAPWEHAYSAARASAAAEMSVRLGSPDVAEEGLSVIDAAIAAHPLQTSYLRQRGDLLSARAKLAGDAAGFSAALDAYQAALTSSPYDVRALVGSATCLQALGQDEEALRRWQTAVDVAPDFEPAIVGLAGASQRRGL